MVLIAAMAVSFGTQDYISGGVIAALVVLNVGVGTINEYKAEKTVAALEAVGSPTATVIRRGGSSKSDGETKTIKTDDVVPGDIVLVKIGDVVPADCRIIPEFLSGLEVDEALLTGESLPSVKTPDSIEDPTCPVGDRTCMIYSGAQVVKGRARCVCVATGMKTELGKIAEAMSRKETNNRSGFAKRWHKFKVFLGLAETTPLQVKLNTIAYILFGAACLLAFIVVASTGFGDVPLTIATYAVAAAVSLLPASLPAVVALSLSNASKTLADNNALVRKMDAIETLAAVTDVCSDKTGTITLGKMVMQKAWIPANLSPKEGGDSQVETDTKTGQLYAVETGSDPYYPRGRVMAIESHEKGDVFGDDDDDDDPERSQDMVDKDTIEPPLRDMVLCASLCSSATIQRSTDKEDEGKGKWEAHGDATEIALLVWAYKLGHGRPHLTHRPDLKRMETAQSDIRKPVKSKTTGGHYEQIIEHPFDSSIKRMTCAYTYHPHPDSQRNEEPHCLVLMKGAFERVFERCNSIFFGDNNTKISGDMKADIMKQYETLASQGLRVLTLVGKKMPKGAADEIKNMERDALEQDMCFLGLAGIYDPPRPESANSVADCHTASVIPRMLTGDHLGTATAIAIQVGIIGKDHPKTAVMTGPDFDKLSEEQIDALDQLPRVVARCAPETKVRMVEALHRRKRTCVMTGDGVNDAPSLKRSDVGVAMGLNGSDVAKQSAEIVLSDDNFATIITAIRKGRGIFFNLQKFLLYLLSGNLAEVLVMMIGLAFIDQNGQSTFPISPVGALWINTLAAGPPALALGLEPTPIDAMQKGPDEFSNMFVFWWFVDLIVYGLIISGLALANFSITLWGYFDGYLGFGCNESISNDVCNFTGQARGACFASFLIILMVHAFTCKHPTKSVFQMNFFDNKTLLVSALVLILSVFPVIYIPVINEEVFLLASLGWEWGMIFASIFVYMAFAEGYKFVRRYYARRQNNKRLAMITTMDNRFINEQAEKKRAQSKGANAV